MAFSLRLSGIGKSTGEELFRIEPSWWTISEVRRLVTLNWVKTNETGSYSDEDADISMNELRKLHEHFKPVILEKISFSIHCLESCKTDTGEHAAARVDGYSKYVSQLKEELRTIDAALGTDADNFAHFHLCIFEWDSGY